MTLPERIGYTLGRLIGRALIAVTPRTTCDCYACNGIDPRTSPEADQLLAARAAKHAQVDAADPDFELWSAQIAGDTPTPIPVRPRPFDQEA